MPSPPIFSHVIGSMAILVFASLLTFAFVSIGNGVINDLVKPQLQEVSDHIANTMLELLALTKSTNEVNVIMVKEVEIPMSLEMYGYNIRLTNRGSAYVVAVSTDMFSWLYGTTEISIREQEAKVDLASGDLPALVNGRRIHKSSIVQSGAKVVIWSIKSQEGITLGLGFYANG
jgi:hypothetical protein